MIVWQNTTKLSQSHISPQPNAFLCGCSDDYLSICVTELQDHFNNIILMDLSTFGYDRFPSNINNEGKSPSNLVRIDI